MKQVVYLETSALLQWLLGQSGGVDVRRKLDQAEAVVTSMLTFAESGRVLVRAEGEGLLRGGDAQRLRGLLNRTRTAWTSMAVTDQVLGRAAQSFPVEPVRTLDAIHLATALEFAVVFPEIRMLSADHRIRDNGEALGLGVPG